MDDHQLFRIEAVIFCVFSYRREQPDIGKGCLFRIPAGIPSFQAAFVCDIPVEPPERNRLFLVDDLLEVLDRIVSPTVFDKSGNLYRVLW